MERYRLDTESDQGETVGPLLFWQGEGREDEQLPLHGAEIEHLGQINGFDSKATSNPEGVPVDDQEGQESAWVGADLSKR